MKKKAARPSGSKKAPQKPARKSVKKTARKAPKPPNKKQATKKKPARKIKAPVVVLQQIEAVQEAGPLDDALVDGPAVHELRIEGPKIEQPAIMTAGSTMEETAVHEAISIETGVIAMSADIVSKEVPSAELASGVQEDLRFGREFMMKYRETFKALAK